MNDTSVTISNAVSFVYFDDSCQVRTPTGSFSFEGGADLFKDISRLWEQKPFSKNDFSEAVSAHFDNKNDIDRLYKFLESNNILIDTDTLYRSEHQLGLYHNHALYPDDESVSWLKDINTVSVDGAGSFHGTVVDTLSGSELFSPGDPDTADLHVFADCCEGYKELLDADQRLAAYNKPYLLLNVDRSMIYLGPLVVPGKTACFHCLSSRMFVNALHKREFNALKSFSNRANNNVIDPVIGRMVSTLIENELIKLKHGCLSSTVLSAQVSFDMISYATTRSEIVRVPKCDHCAAVTQRPVTTLRDTV